MLRAAGTTGTSAVGSHWASAADERTAARAGADFAGANAAGTEARVLRPMVEPREALALASAESGEPLPNIPRRELESFFGADLDLVRVHRGSSAAAVTAAAGANAVTHGRNIYFAPAAWGPGGCSTRGLLAHEVAHVLQGGAPARDAAVAPSGASTNLLEFGYEPSGLTDAQLQIDLAHARHLIAWPLTQWLDVQRAQRSFSRIEAESDRRRPGNAGDDRYSLQLATHPSLVRRLDQLTRAEALRELGHFRARVYARHQASVEGLADMRRIREDQWIVGAISDTLGAVSLPGNEIFEQTRRALRAGDAAFVARDVVGAAREYQQAAHEALRAEQALHAYREGTIGGAEWAVTGLEGVVVVSAVVVTIGTAGAVGPTAGAFVGAGYASTQAVARQASEVHYGLRDRIDWAGISFDFAIGLVTGVLGGRLGNLVLGRLLANPVAASLGRRALARIASDLVAGRVGSTLHLAARTAFDQLRGEANITWDDFLDRMAAHLTDPKGALFDVAMGEAFRRAHGAATRPRPAPVQPARPATDPLQAEIDLAFAEYPAPADPSQRAPLTPGQGVVRTAPEVSAGFAPSHVAPLGRLLGRVLTSSGMSRLGQLWAQTANPGESATLTGANSRRLFDNHRTRFWHAVRGDSQAMQMLADAGLQFDGGPGSAPSYALPGGQRVKMTIDHVVERQSDPTRALDPNNLRISFSRENSVVLRLLNLLPW